MDDPRIAALLGGPQGNPSQEAIEKARLMGLHLMGMAQPDVIGNRPDVQGMVKGFAQSATEPFGQLGSVMTGQSEHWPTDLAGAAAGLAPIGPPGAGKLLKPAAEVVQSATGKLPMLIRALHGTDEAFSGAFDPARMGQNFGDAASRLGFHFTENEKLAKSFGKNLLTRDIETHNPKIINVEDALRDDHRIAVKKGDFSGSFDNYVRDALEGNPYAYYERGMLANDLHDAKNAGHDALVVDFGKLKDSDFGHLKRSIIPFSPTQIKDTSAGGSDPNAIAKQLMGQ